MSWTKKKFYKTPDFIDKDLNSGTSTGIITCLLSSYINKSKLVGLQIASKSDFEPQSNHKQYIIIYYLVLIRISREDWFTPLLYSLALRTGYYRPMTSNIIRCGKNGLNKYIYYQSQNTSNQSTLKISLDSCGLDFFATF